MVIFPLAPDQTIAQMWSSYALVRSKREYYHNCSDFTCFDQSIEIFNPFTPTVTIWVQLWSILSQTGLSCHL